MADRTEQVILEFDVDLEDSIESIESLTKANKELREERKKLNLDTAEGQKRVQEINAQLDKNTSKIKANVSALEQQRFNIGNYRADIEASVPAFGKFAKAQETAGKAATALRLALGPIGIIIGLIVAAITVLIRSFAGTQEGMDKITSVTRPLLAIFDRLIGVLQDLGGKVFKQLAAAVTNPIQAIKNLGSSILELFKIAAEAVTNPLAFIERIRNGVNTLVDFVDEAVAQGQRLDQLQKQIERDEINQITRLKELNLLVKQNKTIVEDETKSFAERTSAALRARAAQNEILSSELSLLDKRIEKLKLQQSLNDTSREDEKELAELEARRFEVQASNAEQSIEFDKKINELRVKNNLALAEQAALERAIMRERNQLGAPTDDPLIGAFETRVNTIANLEDRLQDDLAKRRKEADAAERQRLKAGAQYVQEVEAAKLGIISNAVGAAANLYEQDSEGFKILATAQALINTYLAATAALASGSKINPIFGIISAAAAVASGLASVAQINGIQFAEGGVVLRGKSHAQGGIPIEAEGDEIILTKGVYRNPKLRQMASDINVAGGGRKFADGGLVSNTTTAPINQQMELANIFKTLPPIEVGVKEISKVQNRVRVKENLSKR